VSLGLIKTFNKYVSPYYLVIWLNSPIGREKCSANTYGVGHSQGNLNLSLINNFVIPLPPFNEQKRIVAKVRQLLILCDELEQRVMENQKNSEFLMEAVLKETFSS
jgi:type I restriction enzyme S subunit